MIMKVVIVEDEEIIRRGMVMTIDWLQMDCVVAGSAGNGTEGMQLIAQQHPDIVIADIRMPGMDGLEMIEKAKEKEHFHSILLTSYAEFEYAQKAIELGCDGYLLKPLDEEKLALILSDIERKIETEQKYRRISEMPVRDEQITESVSTPEDPLVEETLRRIRGSRGEHMNIDEIADQLNVSGSYLSRRFKNVTGMTFLDALNRHRVQLSMEALKQDGTPLSDIAECFGFSDYKHFCSVFKRYTGITPSEYKKTGKPHKQNFMDQK